MLRKLYEFPTIINVGEITLAPIQIPGVVMKTVGRTGCVNPLAVVLHEWDSGIEQLDAAMDQCPRPRPTCPQYCHQSFHYGIGGNCNFHQYIPINDTAWGFYEAVVTCPPSICPPDECGSCTGLTVAQYNPDLDGTPPVLPVFVEDTCGTANGCVIHIAVSSMFPTNQSLGSGPCCAPNAEAYRCLVQSLCFVFENAELTPSTTTLLSHCNELVCLDIPQLVTDILVCLNAPTPVPPPCQCTPTVAQICLALSLLPVSQSSTDTVLGDDCQFHPSADAFAVAALDTVTINTTVTEAPANTFTVSGAVIISPDADNNLSVHANGLFAATCVPLLIVSVANAGTVNPASGKVFIYEGVGAGAVTLVAPAPGACSNDLWIKNLSASILTVTTAAQIDGVGVITLDGTTAGTYPFSNNGGETAHLVYDFVNTTWYVL